MWVPAHIGIKGNQLADKLSKSVAKKIQVTGVPGYNVEVQQSLPHYMTVSTVATITQFLIKCFTEFMNRL